MRWSIDGTLFIVQAGSTIDVYNTVCYQLDFYFLCVFSSLIQNMDRLHTIIHPSRLHDVRFCKRIIGEGEVLLVAAEDKKLSIYDISNEPEQIPTVIALMIGHSNRLGYSFYHDAKLLTSLFR